MAHATAERHKAKKVMLSIIALILL